MNQLREAVSIPVESRMSPRTPRSSSRSPQTEHKPNAMNPAYMLTMARPIASNLSAVPCEASHQLRLGCTRALNRAADTLALGLAITGAAISMPPVPFSSVGRTPPRPPALWNMLEGCASRRGSGSGRPGEGGRAPGLGFGAGAHKISGIKRVACWICTVQHAGR
jgi:hypothetical protein